MVVFGTRPEVIKVFPIIKELQRTNDSTLLVVSTAQHRQMVDDLLDLFSITPNHDLNIMRPNQSLADICRNALSGLDPILENERPDCFWCRATQQQLSQLASPHSISRIPVAHIEAGLRSYDRESSLPRRSKRKIISVHVTPPRPNNDKRNKSLQGRHRSKSIHVTGNTVIDALLHTAKKKRNTLSNFLSPER